MGIYLLVVRSSGGVQFFVNGWYTYVYSIQTLSNVQQLPLERTNINRSYIETDSINGLDVAGLTNSGLTQHERQMYVVHRAQGDLPHWEDGQERTDSVSEI